MGAWGNGSFDNDDAADFLSDVTDSSDLTLVREIFAAVLGADKYLEAPDASQAIAAAEIVAAVVGRPTSAAQEEEELSEWIARTKPTADPGLVTQAVQVLDRIVGDNSELRELWEETDELSDWEETVAAVRSKLQV
ncbi:hypothetical protein ABB25_06030 [Stenotrophomonas koreensis]|uniref:DUF4259 domain-containing protein n=1 Tax=Stenotrophomonas koreensis TaxID=266128 RepID=A0A0R0BPJ1_9GAMM|nr:DUF4259 domain-containing protein [Stenotrophomonas koreensis]KRG58713.1 hypothetical protein ABB25_06030 [Stenotrophomonas koreensis]